MDEREYREQAIAMVKHLESEIDRLKAQIEATQESIHHTIFRAVESLHENEKQLFVWEIYWQHQDHVKTTVLSDALNIKSNQLVSYVSKAHAKLPCRICGEEMSVQIRSRAEFKEIMGAYRGGKNSYDMKTCAKCEAEEKRKAEIRSAEWRQQQAERLAYFESLKTMPYYQYLETPEWQAIRLRKMKRSRFRCELCNAAGKLNVHHRTYERRGQEDDKDLIVLCGTCHAKFHDKLPQE